MSENSNAQPSNLSEGSTKKDSETFHKGFGDFSVESSDGVLFYVSRFLLAYTSPVFKDMFTLGPNDNSSTVLSNACTDGSTPRPLQLTEDAETLDLLFRHIDPTLPNLPLNKKTIQKLLEAARKYQIPSIMSWFESEAKKTFILPTGRYHENTLLSTDPMFVLSLATEYNMQNLAQEAVHERVGKGIITQDEPDVPPHLLRRICVLREERIDRYLRTITSVIDAVLSCDPPTSCSKCDRTLGDWIDEMLHTIRYQTKWSEFIEVYNSKGSECNEYDECRSWAGAGEIYLQLLKAEIIRSESTLPEL